MSDVVINNLDPDHERFVVARQCDNGLWFWGSWKYRSAANRVAVELKNGVVIDTHNDVSSILKPTLNQVLESILMEIADNAYESFDGLDYVTMEAVATTIKKHMIDECEEE